MCRMAGDVADGLIGHPIQSLRWIDEVVVASFEEGLSRSGRERKDFDYLPTVCCAIDDDEARAIEMARRTISFYATVKTYMPLWELHGFADNAVAAGDAFRRGDLAAVPAAISDEMVDDLLRRRPARQGPRPGRGDRRARRRPLPHPADLLHLARGAERVPEPHHRRLRPGASALTRVPRMRETRELASWKCWSGCGRSRRGSSRTYGDVSPGRAALRRRGPLRVRRARPALVARRPRRRLARQGRPAAPAPDRRGRARSAASGSTWLGPGFRASQAAGQIRRRDSVPGTATQISGARAEDQLASPDRRLGQVGEEGVHRHPARLFVPLGAVRDRGGAARRACRGHPNRSASRRCGTVVGRPSSTGSTAESLSAPSARPILDQVPVLIAGPAARRAAGLSSEARRLDLELGVEGALRLLVRVPNPPPARGDARRDRRAPGDHTAVGRGSVLGRNSLRTCGSALR